MIDIEGNRTAKVWSNASLCSRHATPVFYAGYLYGIHGSELRCIDAKSGEIKWSEKGIGAGNLIRAGEQLVVQTAKSGEIVLVQVTPEGFKEQRRFKVFDGPSQTMPILVAGRLFCRSAAGNLTCVDLGVKPEPVRQPRKVKPRTVQGV